MQSASGALSLLDRRPDKVLRLHLVELVDAAQAVVVVVVVVQKVISVERQVVRLEIEVLKRHRVGCVVEVVEVAAVERDVGAADAVAGMCGII